MFLKCFCVDRDMTCNDYLMTKYLLPVTIVIIVACQGSLKWEFHAETAEINVSVEINENQCFSDPPYPAFGAMTVMNMGGVCRQLFGVV